MSESDEMKNGTRDRQAMEAIASLGKMKVECILIDVALATEMLKRNKEHQAGVIGTNRPISRMNVVRYAAEMIAGRWHLTHQGIAFDEDGWLKDGQHRLKAVIYAGNTNPDISIPMMVTYGVDEETFQFIDNGMKRKLADSLAVRGITNSIAVTSAAKLFYCYLNVPYENIHSWASGRVDGFTAPVLHDLILKYPGIREGVTFCQAKLFRQTGNLTALATGYALFTEFRPDTDGPGFLHKLQSGLGWQERGEPVFELRKRLQARLRKPASSTERVTQFALLIKTYNKWMMGEEIHALSFDSGGKDSFPRLMMKEKDLPDADD